MAEEMAPIRALEFYSGIGGLRFALERVGIDATVVEAFEINELANDVYEHNFGHRPNQGNIQRLKMKDLDRYRACAWLLSPPCQPYTRQGLQKDSADARASSFLQLLGKLPQLSFPPDYVFVENVVGFETSQTRNQCLDVLYSMGFQIQEFILSPLQFGIPYSRPRYFCLAKRGPKFRYSHLEGQLLRCPLEDLVTPASSVEQQVHCNPIKDYLEADLAAKDCMVPSATIERWGDAFDIVTPESTRCCCFTKSYARYAKGTGSLLITNASAANGGGSLAELGLRYFSPREIANIHSFPASFSFPDNISTNQRYALLGNSLDVTVVSYLLNYLFWRP